jgi:hypothetical protein
MTLDLSECDKLINLNCIKNRIETLDIRGCTSLENLYCKGNWLKTLDLSTNEALKKLDCDESVTVTGNSRPDAALICLLGCLGLLILALMIALLRHKKHA